MTCFPGSAGCDELSQEGSHVGVVADHQDIFVAAALVQQALKLAEVCSWLERLCVENLGLIAHLRPDKLSGLQAALQGAGDDQVEADAEIAQDLSELEAVAFAFLVQGTLDVQLGIRAAGTGTGVAHQEDVQVFTVWVREVTWAGRGRGFRRRKMCVPGGWRGRLMSCGLPGGGLVKVRVVQGIAHF